MLRTISSVERSRPSAAMMSTPPPRRSSSPIRANADSSSRVSTMPGYSLTVAGQFGFGRWLGRLAGAGLARLDHRAEPGEGQLEVDGSLVQHRQLRANSLAEPAESLQRPLRPAPHLRLERH